LQCITRHNHSPDEGFGGQTYTWNPVRAFKFEPISYRAKQLAKKLRSDREKSAKGLTVVAHLGSRFSHSGRGRVIATCVITLLCLAVLSSGQNRPRTVDRQPAITRQDPQDDVVRVNTRVVFIDTLVKDKRTGEPVEGLTREDFEVLDNGQPRTISYFSRQGSIDQRPLALLLVLAPLDDGASHSLQKPEVVSSLTSALARLPADDEVALLLVWRHGSSRLLSDLTRDRAKVGSALAALPKRDNAKSQIRAPTVIQEASLAIAERRPRSQTRVVLVTDSVFLITDAQRDEMIRNLLAANITFNALITGTDPFFAAMSPLLKPAQNELRTSWYDVPQYWAHQTGGDYVRVHKKKDYGPALEKLIGNLAARYSLGFTLPEDERQDGQMHRLEVRVKARNADGSARKVNIIARQAYYPPKS
jgi:VWFA-related protein